MPLKAVRWRAILHDAQQPIGAAARQPRAGSGSWADRAVDLAAVRRHRAQDSPARRHPAAARDARGEGLPAVAAAALPRGPMDLRL
jgi:hypothetical protein